MAKTKEYNYTISGQWSGSWSSTTDSSSWITTSLNDDKLSVTAQDNQTYSARTGHVYVKYNDTTCKTIDVSQAAKSCDCDAINPITASISSIPTSGLSAGTEVATYNNTNPCTTVGGKIYKGSTEVGSLIASSGKLTTSVEIAANNTTASTTYVFSVTYGGIECARISVEQSGISCECPTFSFENDFKIPMEGVDSNTWFLVKKYYISTTTGYNPNCIQYLKVVPIPHPGQIFSSENDFKVEYGGIYSLAEGYNFLEVDISVRNVHANNTGAERSDWCNIMYGSTTCTTLSFIQNGPGCACSSFGTIAKTIQTIPATGLAVGTEIASWSLSPSSCSTNDLTATLSGEGITQTLTRDSTNRKFKLSSAIPANTVQNTKTYTLIVKFDDTNECLNTSIVQEIPSQCDCPEGSQLMGPIGGNGLPNLNTIPRVNVPSPFLLGTFGVLIRTDFNGTITEYDFDTDCLDKIGVVVVDEPYSLLKETGVNVYTEVGASPINWTPAQNHTYTIYPIYVYATGIHNNPNTTSLRANYKVTFNDNECMEVTVTQDGVARCSCNGLFDMVQQNPHAKLFPGSGATNVVFASGNTAGCGQLRAISSTEMISNLGVISSETTSSDGIPVYEYQWTGDVSSYSEEYRSGTINFAFTDWNGKVYNCSDSLVIIQNKDACLCPTFPTFGSLSATFSPTGETIRILDITGYTPTTKSGYNSYCTYVTIIPKNGEDASWLNDNGKSYVSYDPTLQKFYASTYTNINNTCSSRTCILDVWSIVNVSTNGIWKNQFHKYDSNYDILCELLGEIIVTQPPYECTCESMNLSIGTYTISSLTVGNYDYVYFDFLCGSIIDIKCVDENDNEVDFVEVDKSSLPLPAQSDYYTYIPISVPESAASYDDREFYITVTAKSNCDESVICTAREKGVVLGCNCDNASSYYRASYYQGISFNTTSSTTTIQLYGNACDNLVGYTTECDALITSGDCGDDPDKWITNITTNLKPIGDNYSLVIKIYACPNNTGARRKTTLKLKPILTINGETVTCDTTSNEISVTQTVNSNCSSCTQKIGEYHCYDGVFSYDECINDGFTEPQLIIQYESGPTECVPDLLFDICEYKAVTCTTISSLPDTINNFYVTSAISNNVVSIYAIPDSVNQSYTERRLDIKLRTYDGSNNDLGCGCWSVLRQEADPSSCPGECVESSASYILNQIKSNYMPNGGQDSSNGIQLMEGSSCNVPGSDSKIVVQIPKSVIGNCYYVNIDTTSTGICNSNTITPLVLTQEDDGNYLTVSAKCLRCDNQPIDYPLTADIHIQYKDSDGTFKNCSYATAHSKIHFYITKN